MSSSSPYFFANGNLLPWLNTHGQQFEISSQRGWARFATFIFTHGSIAIMVVLQVHKHSLEEL